MPSFDPVTPATALGSRHERSSSARATRGRSASRRRSNGIHNSSDSQEPRKLHLSPAQPRHSENEPPAEEPQLLTLPPSLFPHWCLLMLCSAFCLAAASAGTPLTTNSSTAERSDEIAHYENLQMVMAIATLSLMLTFLAAACYVLVPASFVGTLYEVTVVSKSCCGSNALLFNLTGTIPTKKCADRFEYCFARWESSHRNEPCQRLGCSRAFYC